MASGSSSSATEDLENTEEATGSTGAPESEDSSSGPMASGPFGASGDEGKPLEKFFDAEKDADDDEV